MSKTFYLQINTDNIITDCVEYEVDGYTPISLDLPLPDGLIGGWFKYENNAVVIHEELKPVSQNSVLQTTVNGIVATIGGVIVDDNVSDTLESSKTYQKSLISQACQEAIIGGFTSSAYQSTSKKYGSTMADQINMIGLSLASFSKLAGTPGCENDVLAYHAQGENFVEFTPQECLALTRDYMSFVSGLLVKSSLLQNYIDTLTTIEEVKSVNWNTVIPS